MNTRLNTSYSSTIRIVPARVRVCKCLGLDVYKIVEVVGQGYRFG